MSQNPPQVVPGNLSPWLPELLVQTGVQPLRPISARLLPADHALRLSTTDSACLASPRPPAPPPAAWRFSEGWAWQATRTSFWRHHALLAVFLLLLLFFSPLKWGSPKCMRSCWQFC